MFKKEINRSDKIQRSQLTSNFNIDLSGKDQAALLGIVSQLTNGEVKIIEKNASKTIKKEQTVTPQPRRNNFMN